MVESITKRAAAQEVVKVLNFSKYFSIVMIVGFFLVIGLKFVNYGVEAASYVGITLAIAYTVMAHRRITQLQQRWSLNSPDSTQKVNEQEIKIVPVKEE
jgi:hypothetical protein